VVDFRASDGIVYERFDDYWGDPNAAVAKRVELVGIADGNARASGLITGDFDAAQITPSQVSQVQDAGVEIVANTSLWFIQVYHNRSREFFANPKVTQAMSMALDRDAICAAIYFGFCQPTIKMFPDEYWAGSPDIPNDYYSYDSEGAKELMAEAGYADGFAIELMFAAGSDPYPQLAELLQAQWGEIGIDVTISPVDISQLATTFFVDKRSDALIGGTGGPEPTSLFQTLFTSTGFANPGGVTAEGMDELVDQMSRAIDRDERAEIVRDATRLVVENGLNTLLVFPEYSWGINEDIVNWQPNGVINSPILRGVGVK
jgi:peptide/nickel transport system substrate-binding protein